MIVISHRGNLHGPSSLENQPAYIQTAIDAGFDVEVDVWMHGETLYLGHDRGTYEVDVTFLMHPSIWCHAKNFEAFEYLLNVTNIHCFWHETDKFTLTSEGIIWTYPGNITGKHSVLVTNEPIKTLDIFGVCTDYPFDYT